MNRLHSFAVIIFVCGATLRLAHWPALHEVRDPDELGYSWGSLQLLEGNLPGIHYAPAGPQTWVGWFYESAASLRHLVFPDEKERSAPLQIRPFLAIEHSLFDAYRDTGPLRQFWIAVSFISALAGIVAACGLGVKLAGRPGEIFAGGTVAFLALFVDFSVQARPYIVGWSFGLVALYYAIASSRSRAFAISAVCMGLSVGSRIEMLMLLPVVWSELWLRSSEQERLKKFVRYHAILFLSFVVVAPWYFVTLIGSLRAIATIRGTRTGLTAVRPSAVLWQLVWEQGLFLQLFLFILGIVLWFRDQMRRPWLAIYILALVLSVFKGTFGLRYEGAPLIVIILAGTYALAALRQKFAHIALALSVAALVLPMVQGVRLVVDSRRDYVTDMATPWIEQHVPAETILYVRPWITNTLPTEAASDQAWSEVMSVSAYQRKLQSGMQRFGLSTTEVPRALSEVNLALERANRRFLFILGARQWISIPRYDMRVFETGPAFGVRDVVATFQQTGGVVLLRGPAEDPIAQSLGQPTVAWLNSRGIGTRIFCSPNIQLK
jgi:hypothetical protein